jgi:hypothetical protein
VEVVVMDKWAFRAWAIVLAFAAVTRTIAGINPDALTWWHLSDAAVVICSVWFAVEAWGRA